MPEITKNKVLAPIAVLAACIVFSLTLFLGKDEPEKIVEESLVQEAGYIVAEPKVQEVPIYTQGVVEPKVSIKIISQVSGRILSVSDKWTNGGFFKQGETMLEVEDYTYLNNLAGAEANLAQAQSALIQEEGLAYVAKKEWQSRAKKDDNPAAKSLALREPQLAFAKAKFKAAQTELDVAKRNLEKTKLKAPSDGILNNKSVSEGQIISSGQALGEFVAVDVAEVRVPLTEAQQSFLELPSISESSTLPVKVIYRTAGGESVYDATLVRTEAVLDKLTKVLYGIIEIKDPYGIKTEQQRPLRIGSFVEVEIIGHTETEVVALPKLAIQSRSKVWLITDEGKLHSAEVKTLNVGGEKALITEGIEPGAKIAVSYIKSAQEGLVVEPVLEGSASE